LGNGAAVSSGGVLERNKPLPIALIKKLVDWLVGSFVGWFVGP
jgi:hypothetical protein